MIACGAMVLRAYDGVENAPFTKQTLAPLVNGATLSTPHAGTHFLLPADKSEGTSDGEGNNEA